MIAWPCLAILKRRHISNTNAPNNEAQLAAAISMSQYFHAEIFHRSNITNKYLKLFCRNHHLHYQQCPYTYENKIDEEFVDWHFNIIFMS